MKIQFVSLALAAALLAGCGGGGLTGGLTKAFGIALPTSTPLAALTVTPGALTMSASGASAKQTITASELNASGFSAQTTDATIATVAPASGASNAFVVSALKPGTCTINVSDYNGQTTAVKVTVQ
ncbi:MAG: hypothetical protein NVSMB64_21300 [Candidatus Velthaea sp.]